MKTATELSGQQLVQREVDISQAFALQGVAPTPEAIKVARAVWLTASNRGRVAGYSEAKRDVERALGDLGLSL